MRLARNALEPAACAALFGPHLEQILAIRREVIPQRHAAPRSQRQIVADPHVLIAVGRHEERFRHRHASRTCERHLTDLRGRTKIPFREHGRQRQRVGVVVEAVSGDVVRQHRRGVDLERQQIADGVAIFGAVETRQRGTARVGLCQGCPVELCLEIRNQTPRRRLCRAADVRPAASHRCEPCESRAPRPLGCRQRAPNRECSSARPPDFTFSLWQLTQYFCTVALCVATASPCGAAALCDGCAGAGAACAYAGTRL